MKDYLSLIDTKTSGNRYDVTPLFSSPSAFGALIGDLLPRIPQNEVDLVAGIDALGFILATAIALRLNVGMLAVRKAGKLPVPTAKAEFRDYTGLEKGLEIRLDILRAGMRVLVVDEWVETGAQVSAAIELIEGQGAEIAGIVAIAMDDNPRTQNLRAKYQVITVWDDDP